MEKHKRPAKKTLLPVISSQAFSSQSAILRTIQQSDSQIYNILTYKYNNHFHFQTLFHYSYYKIFNIAPCAIQQVLAGCLFYTEQCVSINPKHLMVLS